MLRIFAFNSSNWPHWSNKFKITLPVDFKYIWMYFHIHLRLKNVSALSPVCTSLFPGILTGASFDVSALKTEGFSELYNHQRLSPFGDHFDLLKIDLSLHAELLLLSVHGLLLLIESRRLYWKAHFPASYFAATFCPFLSSLNFTGLQSLFSLGSVLKYLSCESCRTYLI